MMRRVDWALYLLLALIDGVADKTHSRTRRKSVWDPRAMLVETTAKRGEWLAIKLARRCTMRAMCRALFLEPE
jgi:hypothetical protein